METILGLVAAIFHLIGASVGRLVAAVGLAVLFVFTFWFQVFRLDLWATPGLWIGAAFCWLGLWLASVLYDTGKPAKGIGIVCTVFLVGITIARLLPGTTEGGKKVASYQDQKNRARADKAVVEVIRPFDCNSANTDTISYFGRDGVTGERVALIFTTRDSKGRVLCFREQGVYDKTGEPVKPVTTAIIDEIAHQTPPEVPAPVPTPQTVQVAAVAAPPPAVSETAVQPQPEWGPERVIRIEPQTHTVARGTMLSVLVNKRVDVALRGEDYQFEGTLVNDLTVDGMIVAKSGSPAGVTVTSLTVDERAHTAVVALGIKWITTPGGKLPVDALDQSFTIRSPHQPDDQPNPGIYGARIPQVRIGIEEYILPPGLLRASLISPLEVPAVMVASAH